MEPERAARIVERLRAGGVMAHLAHSGVYTVGIRVVLQDGREAVWDTDGAAGLEAQVLRDGVLVDFVPEIPNSADLDDDGIVETIARTDYGTDASGG